MKGDGFLEAYARRVAGLDAEGEVPQQQGEHNRELHVGEALPDAVARACAEGDVLERMLQC